MRARQRQRRQRLTFFVSVAVIVAAVATTIYVARTRAIPFQFSLQAASAPGAKSFDHFDFSYYWLATHGQPSLAIHGQAAFLVDLDARQVLWQRDAETERPPASLTKMVTAMVAVDDAGSGLAASHFVNPSGLDAAGHGMSAHDLAHTAAYLDTYYPQLASIAATKEITISASATHKAFQPHNLNTLLWSYPGATGLKTGLTDNAGGCMVATAIRAGRHLIAVVMNATLHSAEDATALLNYGFSVHPTRAFGPWASVPH